MSDKPNAHKPTSHRLLTPRILAADPADAPRTRGPIRTPPRIGRLTAAAAQPVFRRLGFEDAFIFEHWTEIIGPELAAHVTPQKLSRARAGQPRTLTLAAPGPLSLELQHRSPQILERINAFYGYRAVGRLRIVHT